LSYYLAKFVYKDEECGWDVEYVGCKITDGISAKKRAIDFMENHVYYCIYSFIEDFTPLDKEYFNFARRIIGEESFIDLDQNPNQEATKK